MYACLIKILNAGRWRRVYLVLFDILCFAAVNAFFYFVALYVANSVPVEDSRAFWWNVALHFLGLLLARLIFRIYKNIWRYANTKAYFDLVLADAVGSVAALAFLRVIQSVSPGVYYGVWQIATVGSMTALTALISRFCYSLLYKKVSKTKTLKVRVPVAIAGAGRLGSYLAEDLINNPNSGYDPLFFIDVDTTKIGNMVSGLVVYDNNMGQRLIQKLGIREVFVAITTQESEKLSQLYHYYTSLGCKVRIYDSMVRDSERENEPGKNILRDFSIEDLLFRKPVTFKDENAAAFYRGKTVLITGGGGSIGSELCRRVAACGPKELIVFDIYENNTYELQQELIRSYGDDLKLSVEIGSVRDAERVEQLFERYRPEIVFHAAAHKHVPLMEHCGAEAIKNNVLGTYYVANAAEKYGVKKFILISTDKAVNPTNVMGASKRMCEMIIQCRSNSSTSFAAVRFGNVLGSNGSVIPLFKKQIAQGGPVTVTDKRIIRYFMTIPEATQLLLHTGVMAKAGELFVLDMGKPVKIYELAENMIKLSGLEPGKDIEIVEVGLRPGEKLYEELLMKTDRLDQTENHLIFVEHDIPYSRETVDAKLQLLTDAMAAGSSIRDALKQVVPTYCDANEINQRAENAKEMKLV